MISTCLGLASVSETSSIFKPIFLIKRNEFCVRGGLSSPRLRFRRLAGFSSSSSSSYVELLNEMENEKRSDYVILVLLRFPLFSNSQ